MQPSQSHPIQMFTHMRTTNADKCTMKKHSIASVSRNMFDERAKRTIRHRVRVHHIDIVIWTCVCVCVCALMKEPSHIHHCLCEVKRNKKKKKKERKKNNEVYITLGRRHCWKFSSFATHSVRQIQVFSFHFRLIQEKRRWKKSQKKKKQIIKRKKNTFNIFDWLIFNSFSFR